MSITIKRIVCAVEDLDHSLGFYKEKIDDLFAEFQEEIEQLHDLISDYEEEQKEKTIHEDPEGED